jgi:hypothetical protein
MPSIDLYATRLTLIIKKTRQKEKKIDQPIIIICVYTRPGFKFICLFFFLASISVEMWSDSAVSFYLLIDKTSACVFLLAPQKIQRTGLEYILHGSPQSQLERSNIAFCPVSSRSYGVGCTAGAPRSFGGFFRLYLSFFVFFFIRSHTMCRATKTAQSHRSVAHPSCTLFLPNLHGNNDGFNKPLLMIPLQLIVQTIRCVEIY